MPQTPPPLSPPGGQVTDQLMPGCKAILQPRLLFLLFLPPDGQYWHVQALYICDAYLTRQALHQTPSPPLCPPPPPLLLPPPRQCWDLICHFWLQCCIAHFFSLAFSASRLPVLSLEGRSVWEGSALPNLIEPCNKPQPSDAWKGKVLLIGLDCPPCKPPGVEVREALNHARPHHVSLLTPKVI